MLDIAHRMKAYERCAEYILPSRIPVIIRIDGRAFHAVAKRAYGREWSDSFVDTMADVAKALMKDMQGCKFCYVQSDEISFLLTNYAMINTQGWFGYDVRKMISISASLAASVFRDKSEFGSVVSFDSRCFSMPQDDVANYFVWRQIDAIRNAIQFAGQEHFSPKQLYGKSCDDVSQMLLSEKGVDIADFSFRRRRGFCIVDGKIDWAIPLFTGDRDYIEKWVYVRED